LAVLDVTLFILSIRRLWILDLGIEILNLRHFMWWLVAIIDLWLCVVYLRPDLIL